MKNKYLTLCISLVIAFFELTSLAQDFEIYLFEDFEHGGSKPAGWTEQAVSGTRPWRFEDGGYAPSSAPNFRHPPNAYNGNYNALFQDENVGPARKLITPYIDLRNSIKPTLFFWHAQEAWGSSVDELKIYYRVDIFSTWILLEHYTLETENWTKREVQLPDEAKTQTCQIAFEGISNWGWGVCIDDVKVEEKGVLPRKVESFSLKQFSGIFPTGSTVNPFAYLDVFITGNSGNIPVNSIEFDYSGTDINDIKDVKLYHTSDSVFSISTPINGSISINGNIVTIEAPAFNLSTGENYLWFGFDIENAALHGNNIDFLINSNSVSLGDKTFPSSTLDPSQSATIHKSLFYDDFEGVDNWIKTDLWEIGTPVGSGTYDPVLAYSGNKFMATNLDGNYPPDISSSSPHTSVYGSVDATYYQDLKLIYKRWLNIEYFDKARVDVSNNGGLTWTRVYENSGDVLDRHWRTINHNINTLAHGKDDIRIKFSIDNTNSYTEYGGWNIDNFAITGEFIHSDVGVVDMTGPLQVCGLTDAETVKVKVRNFGGATVSTPFEVGYSLDGGTTFVKEWFNNPIASEADPEGEVEMEFTFSTPADLTVPGSKNMVFSTFLNVDQNSQNDAFSKTFYVFPTIGFPYQASFESSASYWHPHGTNSTWQWGSPAGNIIKSASDGNRVWATSLAKNYKNSELSFLESPCFNLSDAEYPVLSFDYLMQVETGVDGMSIEYSVDGGTTWQLLTANENFNFNWYNTVNVTALGTEGWSQNHESYKTAGTLLPPEATGIDGVKFRFVFASNGNNNFEGVALDMIRIYEMPYDVGISELVSPQDACEIGYDIPLELRVKNFGYRPVPAGTEIPVELSVTGHSLMLDTLTLTVAIDQGETEDIETLREFTMYSAGLYDVVAYTMFSEDHNRSNDTISTQVDVYGMPGYSIGADIGTMSPDTVILAAGSGYEFYNWYKETAPDTWDPVGSSSTYEIPASGWGIYRVDVTSFESCTAADTIEIIESDKNTGVTEIFNMSDACEYPLPVSPQVTIKNYGPATYNGIEEIPISVMLNGTEVLTEMFVPVNGFAENDEISFTFSGSIDLSEPGTHEISIYTNLSKDLDKNNDTTHTQVTVYGMPDVSMVAELYEPASGDTDTIATISADTLVFATNGGFLTYLWEQKNAGSGSWITVGNNDTLKLSELLDNLPSAWYRVTVTDINSCGFDMDSIYVNATDPGIQEIINPPDTLCYNSEGTILSMLIKNFGHDILPAGTEIEAEAVTPAGNQYISFMTASPLGHGDEFSFDFPEIVMLPEGDNFILLSATIAGDPNPTNNYQERIVTVNPLPSVSIDPGTVYKIFEPTETYQIAPEYSEDVIEYLWHDGYSQANYDIWGIPSYEKYKVTATNEHGCPASDSILVVTSDLSVHSIVSPASDCELENEMLVEFILLNNGNTTYPENTDIDITVSIDETPVATETLTLASPLYSKNSINVTLDHKPNLAHLQAATVTIEISTEDEEVYYDNNSRNKSVYALGYPEISLGEDRIVRDWEEKLTPGQYYETYLWQDASTDSVFTVTETGIFNVKVTDFSGCPGYDTVNITVLRPDYAVINILDPVSDCSHTENEGVTVTVKNLGTDTLFIGDVLPVMLKLNGTTVSEETITLNSRLDPEQELEYTFNHTINLSAVNVYQISAGTNHPLDLVPENDDSELSIETYGFPTTLITSIDPVCADLEAFELTQGSPEGGTYSGTGVTGNLFDPGLAGAGIHTISYTYTDENNCTSNTHRDITVHALPEVSPGYSHEICIDAEPVELAGGSPEGGLYSGTGVSEGFFYPSTAGAGIHAVTYSYTDLNGCTDNATSNITVNSLPEVTLADIGHACIDDEPLELSGGSPASGNYSGAGVNEGIFSPLTAGAGIHTITYTYTDNNNCTNSASNDITVHELPEVTVSTLEGVYVDDDPFELTQGSPSGGIYSGDGVFENVFDPADAGVGIHLINYTYTDGNGCKDSDQADLRVYDVTDVTFTDPDPVCIDSSPFELTQGRPEGGEYSGPGVTGVIFDPASAGTGYHTLTYTVIDDLGNPVEASSHITVNSLPVVEISDMTPLCLNEEEVELIYGSPAYGEYSGTGVNEGFFSPVSAGAGTHTITYTYTDGNGCTNSVSGDLTVNSLPLVDLGLDRSTSEPLVLDAGADFSSYQWQDGSTGQIYTVTAEGLYHVTVTDQNGCQGYDEVYITWLQVPDPVIDNIEMPVAECYMEYLPVEVDIFNQGTGDIPAYESMEIVYQVAGMEEVSESVTVDSDFGAGTFINHVFDSPLTLEPGIHTLYFWVIYNLQASGVTEHEIEIYPLPDADLGFDTLEVTFPHMLAAGSNGDIYEWSTGSNDPTITAHETGRYWLTLTSDLGCTNSDTIYLHDPTFVHKIPHTENIISVYPNPVRDILNLELMADKPGNFTIELISSRGRTLYQTAVNADGILKKEINVSRFAPGIYFLKVSQGNEKIVTKIIIDN